jgi:hypothetical protein
MRFDFQWWGKTGQELSHSRPIPPRLSLW